MTSTTLGIGALAGAHPGQTAWIVGKGPSLDAVTRDDFGRGPVICLNETIVTIEGLHIPNPVYSIQQDGRPQCMRKPDAAPLLLSNNSIQFFADHPTRYHYTADALGLAPDAFTALSAIRIAQIMGCSRIVFVAFDACVSGDLAYATNTENWWRHPKNDWRFPIHCERMRALLADFPHDWLSPGLTKNGHRVTVVTPTGDRPGAFALCKRWIKRQTLQPAQWLVVDDGKTPLSRDLAHGTDYLRREPRRDDPPHTLRRQILAALPSIRENRVIIMEDDDYYRPGYLEAMAKKLNRHDLTGQGRAIYYHLPKRRFAENPNVEHASWCQTGFTSAAFDTLERICRDREGYFVDLDLWGQFVGLKKVFFGRPLMIGIKGLPGRKGLSSGHKGGGVQPDGFWCPDTHLTIFRELLGADASAYEELIAQEASSGQN